MDCKGEQVQITRFRSGLLRQKKNRRLLSHYCYSCDRFHAHHSDLFGISYRRIELRTNDCTQKRNLHWNTFGIYTSFLCDYDVLYKGETTRDSGRCSSVSLECPIARLAYSDPITFTDTVQSWWCFSVMWVMVRYKNDEVL